MPASTVAEAIPPPAPTTTRGAFLIAAGKLDTWNAIGQIVVHTDGAIYDGRAQMLDLYAVRYRGEAFMLIARGLPLSADMREPATLVTATTLSGKPIDSDAAAALLALLERELPAEIVRVRAQQALDRSAPSRTPVKKKRRAGR